MKTTPKITSCNECGSLFVYNTSRSERCLDCRKKRRAIQKRQVNLRINSERTKAIDAIKLASGCVDCGYNLHPEALDFDHIEGIKEFNIGKFKGLAWYRIELEIAKCEVVCANCHRVRTAKRIREALNV